MMSAVALSLAAALTVQIVSRGGERNAAARLLDGRGTVLDEIELPFPKASVRSTKLAGRVLWLLEVDPEPLAGMYSGKSTYVVDTKGARLRYVEAVDPASGEKRRISLLEGSSATWRLKRGV